MKPIIFPLPFFGLAFRFEFVRVARKPANDPKPPVPTFEFVESMRRQFNAHILQDIGIDKSRLE